MTRIPRAHVHIHVPDRVPGGIRSYVCSEGHGQLQLQLEREMGHPGAEIKAGCIVPCLGYVDPEPAVGKD